MIQKVVITVVGKNTTGIIAKCSTFLYEHNVDILDIAQTVLDGIFNMMMIVDVTQMDIAFDELAAGMNEISAGIGVEIHCQREEIFDMMNRI